MRWFGRRSPRRSLPVLPIAPLVDQAALAERLLRERVIDLERRSQAAEEIHRAMLEELRTQRALVGALGGTMGTCETYLGQLVMMARDVVPAVLVAAAMPHPPREQP